LCIEHVEAKLSQVQGDSGPIVKQKLKAVVEKNPGLKEMRKIRNIFIGRNGKGKILNYLPM
jgi:hypothetical protein